MEVRRVAVLCWLCWRQWLPWGSKPGGPAGTPRPRVYVIIVPLSLGDPVPDRPGPRKMEDAVAGLRRPE
jgi:hypothetical protein